MKPASEILKEVRESYENDPTNWHLFYAPDGKGCYNVIFTQEDYAWIIKQDTVFSAPEHITAVGEKIKIDEDFGDYLTTLKKEHRYGLRKTSTNFIVKFLCSELGVSDLVSHFGQDTLTTEKALQRGFASVGTSILSTDPLNVTKKQVDLERKLRRGIVKKADFLRAYV